MKQRPTSAGVSDLRGRAEARLRKRRKTGPFAPAASASRADPERLVHELQVHQVELELQNASLQEARDHLEVLLEKYTALYEFAPVGYFSLDEQGRILETNLTGAALLGTDRSRLNQARLARFLSPESRPAFQAFLTRVFNAPESQVCAAKLLKPDKNSCWINLHSAPPIASLPAMNSRRVTASDITSLKAAEEARRNVEILGAANQHLRHEIDRRETVEVALHKSDRRLSRTLQQSQRMQQQLRHLSHRILEVQEEERKRISRELHDELTQNLVGINLALQGLSQESNANRAAIRRAVAQARRLVQKSVATAHRFARDLRPTALDDLGLIPALHSFLGEFMKRTGVRVHLRVPSTGQMEKVGSVNRTVLYRVAQEALCNVAQHANASQVDVCIRQSPDAVLMEIADNGTSFTAKRTARAPKDRRLGLLGMRERLEMVGGSFSITSAKGKGTTIRAQIPLLNPPARRKRAVSSKAHRKTKKNPRNRS